MGGKEDVGPLWHGVERVHAEPEPDPAIIDPVVEAATDTGSADEQQTAIDSPEPEPADTHPSAAISALNLEVMTSIDLAVLITSRRGTVRQPFKAAALLAERSEWHHLEDCADMLCHRYEPDELLLGLHLIRRYCAAYPNIRQGRIWRVRTLAQDGDPRVAAAAHRVIEATSSGY